MNSRQLSFYLTRRDHAELEDLVRKVTPWLPVKDILEAGKPVVLNSSLVQHMGTERLQIFLCSPAQLEEMVSSHIPDQHCRIVDVVRSPTIEFSRCYQTRDSLRIGRLYYVTKYYDSEGKLVSKNKAFLDWADTVFKTVKKALKKGEDGIYYGSEADQLRDQLNLVI